MNKGIYNFLYGIYCLHLDLRKKMQFFILRKKWRRSNRHNYTSAENNDFPIDRVTVGDKTYGPLTVYSFENIADSKLQIGNFCSIAKNVTFILGGNHMYSTISTYPRHLIDEFDGLDSFSKGPIVIEDDVWIGFGSIILSGVKLSKGTVVGAGSVVTKSTEPYSIVVGNPAKLMKKRFSDEIIKQLINIDLLNVFQKKNKDWCFSSVDEKVLNNIKKL